MKKNYYLRLLLSLFLFLFLLTYKNAYSHEIKVGVSLSPAGGFEIHSKELIGTLEKNKDDMFSKEFSIAVISLKTGIDLRDEHLHKHLNIKDSPKIFLKNLIIKDNSGEGVLEINHVLRNIKFDVKKIDKNKLFTKFTLIPTDFGLKQAEYMGIGVVDEVEIEVTIEYNN